MALLIASTPFHWDHSFTVVWGDASNSPTLRQVVNGAYQQDWTGNGFTYDAGGWTGGRLTATTLTINGVEQHTISGLDVPAVEVRSFIDSASPIQLLVFLLQGEDTVVGSSQIDGLNGFAGDDFLSAGRGDDSLWGGDGNDTLRGGRGADYMVGGEGNDVYHVDNLDDKIDESSFAGFDRVLVSVDGYIVPANIESVTSVGGAQAAPYFVAALQSGYEWGAFGRAITLTYGFLTHDTPGNTSSGFYPLTAEQKALVRECLADWAAQSGITFVEQGDAASADIRFGSNDNSGGYAYYPRYGEVWIGRSAYSDYLVLHEIGHALGLKHPGNYGGAPGPYLPASEDHQGNTVMSYFGAGHSISDIGPFDVAAIQYLYGPNLAVRTGNDTYHLSGAEHIVWDGGGVDTLSAAGQNARAHIDLNDGRWSWVGEKFDSILDEGQYFLSYWTRIENATGGNRADSISGNELANVLKGRDGSDELAGGAGRDTLSGGAGRDRYVFREPAGAEPDHILDFASGADTVMLDDLVFDEIGPLGDFAAGDARFRLGTRALDSDDRLIYNPDNGRLSYDVDGVGGAAAQLIALLRGAPALGAEDITVI